MCISRTTPRTHLKSHYLKKKCARNASNISIRICTPTPRHTHTHAHTQSSLIPGGGACVGRGMQPHMSPTDGQPSSELSHRGTAPLEDHNFVLFSPHGTWYSGISLANAFASPDLFKRTELFNVQPCSSSRLAVRCCPSTTHRSSSSSPVEATCRFFFQLLIDCTHGCVRFVLVFFSNSARNETA